MPDEPLRYGVDSPPVEVLISSAPLGDGGTLGPNTTAAWRA
ncbi:hypothetical protein ACFV23_09410 [Streptomyces sp. NPDC059627]